MVNNYKASPFKNRASLCKLRVNKSVHLRSCLTVTHIQFMSTVRENFQESEKAPMNASATERRALQLLSQ